MGAAALPLILGCKSEQPKMFEGVVVKEMFHSTPRTAREDSYEMVVQFPDSSKRTYQYIGYYARRADAVFDVGSKVKFVSGTLPDPYKQ